MEKTLGQSRLALLVIGLGVLVALGSAVHLTQGTANLDSWDVLRMVFGAETEDTAAVVLESRLPRLAAALVAGVALGVSGAALQSVARNVMASPDTLAVDAGAHLAIVAVAAVGLSLPPLGAAGVAFTSGQGIARLVLAGTAIALAMISATRVLLLLFSEETRGLFAWGAGSLGQNGLDGVRTLGPVVGAALLLLLLLSRRLDLMYLGDDHARTLGVHVGRIRFATIALAVLLAATAVTIAGPIGFVGLAAPALIRLLSNVVPGLHRHAALLPVSAAMGVALLLGDVVNWVTGQAGPLVSGVMENRVPRVAASFLAGASLALAGAVVQAVARNPLAEPGVIGVSGGAGLGAVTVITLVSGVGFWTQAGFAGIGAAVAMAVVFALAARGGLASERLVLIGFGMQAATQALVTLLITLSDPWNEAKALTWLGGSTYGRSFAHLVPMALEILLVVPLLVRARGELDLLSLDDETPRVLGVPVPRSRLLLLVGAVLLTGSAVAGIGVIAFVGLVAPHAARAIVGRRHARVLPVAALLGALLVGLTDTVGRTVIAPSQLPAGLMTALIGVPYFVWLLQRSRVATTLRG